MDDPFLDPCSPSEATRERPPGPFGTDEDLPHDVNKWKNRVHPTTKARTLVIDFAWERASANRILDSLQTHTHKWTLSTVKKREAFDRADNSDSAQSLFVLDRFALRLADAETLRGLRAAPAAGADAAAQAAAAVALRTRQEARVATWIADVANPVTLADKSALLTACELTPQELVVYKEFVRVYDASLCHFLPGCCTVKVRRFLNAERIQAENLAVPLPLKWKQHRKKLVERMRDSSKNDLLITFVLKVREEHLIPYRLPLGRRASLRTRHTRKRRHRHARVDLGLVCPGVFEQRGENYP